MQTAACFREKLCDLTFISHLNVIVMFGITKMTSASLHQVYGFLLLGSRTAASGHDLSVLRIHTPSTIGLSVKSTVKRLEQLRPGLHW